MRLVRDRSRITVVHVIESSAPSRFFSNLVEHTDQARWRLIVATLGPAGRVHADMVERGAEASALGALGRPQYPLASARLVRLIRGANASVVHCHGIEMTLLGMLASQLTPSPVAVFTRHYADLLRRADIASWKRAALFGVERLTARLADAIVSPSQAVRAELIREGVDARKIRNIPYGFDFTRMQRIDPAAVAAIRSEFLLETAFTAVAVGRLSWEKSYPTLLRAWRGIAADHPTARLLVVGDGPLRDQLVQLAYILGVGSSVTFTGWRSDALTIIAAADVVIHVSWTEAMQQVAVEALALAKPLVGTSVGIVGEPLLDGEHCLVVPADDDAAVRAAVDRIARDPGLGRGLGERGREFVVREFPITRMVEAYGKLYEELLASRSAQRES
jgi:glycosyltransferase involved in cell wall biosynthesis